MKELHKLTPEEKEDIESCIVDSPAMQELRKLIQSELTNEEFWKIYNNQTDIKEMFGVSFIITEKKEPKDGNK